MGWLHIYLHLFGTFLEMINLAKCAGGRRIDVGDEPVSAGS